MKKLAFVIQRFGSDILGGAEQLCRGVVNLLKDKFEITVLTTTARDYITWASVYPPGEEIAEGVRIYRFPVEKERDIDSFNRLSERIFSMENRTLSMEDNWFCEQGPFAPELVRFVEKSADVFDLFLFFTYLYYPTIYGLPLVKEKSILIPAAHDEPPFYLQRVARIIKEAPSIIFNTESERSLVEKTYGLRDKKTVVAGMYIKPVIITKNIRPKIKGRYLLYLGRIDKGKGVFELIDHFQALKSKYRNLKLVCLGGSSGQVYASEDVIFPGFVSEDDKLNWIINSEFVVIPSRLESLSIILLEAFAAGKPVLVNARSDVMLDHCRNSNGGLWYSNSDEFCTAAGYLLDNRNIRENIGLRGRKYVIDNYSADPVESKYIDIISRSMG